VHVQEGVEVQTSHLLRCHSPNVSKPGGGCKVHEGLVVAVVAVVAVVVAAVVAVVVAVVAVVVAAVTVVMAVVGAMVAAVEVVKRWPQGCGPVHCGDWGRRVWGPLRRGALLPQPCGGSSGLCHGRQSEGDGGVQHGLYSCSKRALNQKAVARGVICVLKGGLWGGVLLPLGLWCGRPLLGGLYAAA